MADEPDSGFLARWSQRKAAARRQPAAAEPSDAKAVAPSAMPAEAEPQPDLTTLPPIETLTAESDFAPFLARGIPDALRREALRKLWLVEPSVRDYVPLVEYNWDFTAPGYGDLLPTDDVQKLLKHILSEKDEAAPETASDTAPGGAAAEAATVPQAMIAPPPPVAVRLSAPQAAAQADPGPGAETSSPNRAAEQPDSAAAPRLPRRHGGALPG